ncbi:MAG: PTS cellobiose transporter subunit IIC [Alistipes sp.]|nr:PTS cellobiose transporter subunit IIC [Alistipes sp.]
MGIQIVSVVVGADCLHSAGIGGALEGVAAERVCGVVCYGVSGEVGYHLLLSNLKSAIRGIFGSCVPVTLIPQQLLPGGGLRIDIYTLEQGCEVEFSELSGVCYGRMHGGSLIFIEGVAASDFTASVAEQSREVFGRIEQILALHGFSVDDIVRQWNYIGSIVGYRGDRQNYQEFNDARTHFYAQGQWQRGYPAATGIGAEGEGVIVGCIAYRGEEVYPIDNPLQVAAHSYSREVLIDSRADAMKSTPKFERAKLIQTPLGAICFVSGTAAIRGEQSIEAQSVELQTERTIENIAHLVSTENLERCGCKPYELRYAQLQVFIKHARDYEAVRAIVEQAYGQVAVVYTVADVCRSELLVEIEGILTANI